MAIDARKKPQAPIDLDNRPLIHDKFHSTERNVETGVGMSESIGLELKDYFTGLNVLGVLADLDESITALVSHKGISSQICQSLGVRKLFALLIVFDSFALHGTRVDPDGFLNFAETFQVMEEKRQQRSSWPAFGPPEVHYGNFDALWENLDNVVSSELNAAKLRSSEIDMLEQNFAQLDIQKEKEGLISDFWEGLKRMQKSNLLAEKWIDLLGPMYCWVNWNSEQSESLCAEIWQVVRKELMDLPEVESFKDLVSLVFSVLIDVVPSRISCPRAGTLDWWSFESLYKSALQQGLKVRLRYKPEGKK